VRFPIVRAVLRALSGLPRPLKRLVAGRPVEIDGRRLDLDVQVLLRVLGGADAAEAPPLSEQRRLSDAAAGLAEQVTHGVTSRPLELELDAGTDGARTLAARLYEPESLAGAPSGLLVFLHGGGFVLGSLVSGDPLCRTLALQAGVRVLSVEYRLAPEHPFPAALTDAARALVWALEHAEELGADPASVAVGGDSAGANLALTAAHQLARRGLPTAAFVLALYPVTDVERTGGSRDLFATGFGLRSADIDAYERLYLPDGSDPIRPTGLLQAHDLDVMPPSYVATAGFDPLRDEGEELAARLADAGVPVVSRRFAGLVHGYAGLNGLSAAAHDAVLDAGSALRAGLALSTSPRRVAARQGPASPGGAWPASGAAPADAHSARSR
jgi:acetyl esterase